MFKIENVTKQYNGEYALSNISLIIKEGLNFIVGASGSGKTTLLRILSGMEQDFEGEVSYCGKNIKTLSPKEKGYFYNNIFGFEWQDLHLLEDHSVLENVVLPCHLKNDINYKQAKRILKDLKINHMAMKKVKHLSGGQKQRVAIARELMKNPQVLIFDEPTSALDEKTSKATMELLRTLSKDKVVIIVTHDISIITGLDTVFELDKGKLITEQEVDFDKELAVNLQNTHHLSLNHALTISMSNAKRKISRFTISVLTLMIASVLLLTTLSGAISGSGQSEFDDLIKTYGESLMDISIIDSFTDASGTGSDETRGPDGSVDQNIDGLYDQYVKDKRLSFITYTQAFDDINIALGGKDYQIQNSGNAPVLNKLVAGKMPVNDTNEVIVPESLLQKAGIPIEQAIGKELSFDASIYDWSTGQPILKDVSCKAKIVGVIDTTATYEYEGEINTFDVEDSFFFSKSAITDMIAQADSDMKNIDFLIRAKTPADMIAIKDELNKKGIVPLGRFELVEDMVRLNHQTTKQSGSASIVVVVLSFVMVIAVFFITGRLRRKEYAIYKISGYTTMHLFIIYFAEFLICSLASVILMCISSPALNVITQQLFHVNILHMKMLSFGAIMILVCATIAYFTTALTFIKFDISDSLKVGDKS